MFHFLDTCWMDKYKTFIRESSVGKCPRLRTDFRKGFTCYWGEARKGFWRLKLTSRRDRFTAKLKGLREFLWKNLNTEHQDETLETVIRVGRGWINYHNVSDNERKVDAFRRHCMRIIFKWINRKGRRHPMSWERFNIMLKTIGFPKGENYIDVPYSLNMC